MRLTVEQLRRIIKEEIENLHENSKFLDSEGNDFSGVHDHDRARIVRANKELEAAIETLGHRINDEALYAKAVKTISDGGTQDLSEENIYKAMAHLSQFY